MKSLIFTFFTITLAQINGDINNVARIHMDRFNNIVLSSNVDEFKANFTNPYYIRWCDDEWQPHTLEIKVDDDFVYPIGLSDSLGLGVVAFNAVDQGDRLLYETKGFDMHNRHEMVLEGNVWKFKSEERKRCGKLV